MVSDHNIINQARYKDGWILNCEKIDYTKYNTNGTTLSSGVFATEAKKMIRTNGRAI